MFRLTREIRFAVNLAPDGQLNDVPSNTFGGFPSLTGFGQYFALDVTVAGQADADTGFLCNIKAIDQLARQMAAGIASSHFYAAEKHRAQHGFDLPILFFEDLREKFAKELPHVALEQVRLHYSPMLSASCHATEFPMIRLSQRFEFSASHRLFRPDFSDEENRQTFGKCSNPHGHGHNYEFEVALSGKPDKNGLLVNVPEFERLVATTVVDRFDHKNLNVETTEFRDLIPTVENIARVIYQMLKPKLTSQNTGLASVTVWETPKTWCEYSE
jgi:6-pyruvoyltetrahydropterin/6-carboxytetrahydropterin synthase